MIIAVTESAAAIEYNDIYLLDTEKLDTDLSELILEALEGHETVSSVNIPQRYWEALEKGKVEPPQKVNDLLFLFIE